MKLITLLFFTVTFGLNTQAHEYHFAFAEAEYNWQSKTIQASVSLSTHDFEHTLSQNGTAVNHLESYSNDKLMQISLSDKVLDHFKINMGDTECIFSFIGYEVLNTGMTNFYFESQPIDFNPNIIVLFDIMIHDNNEQQNKLTFINNKEKITLPFIYGQPRQSFKLETTKE